MIPSREELEVQIDEARWDWLRAHLERGGLVLVAPSQNLAEVGVKMAADDADAIKELVDTGALSKPSAAQIAEWDVLSERSFRILIISPYVLMQQIDFH